MSNKIVSVVIVTCGKNGYLASCLNSLKQQTHHEVEIIIIDNSLDHNFSQETSQRYPEFKLYPQNRNLYYCEALNLGIRQSRGDFILCLNDDVTLDKRFIEEALGGFSIGYNIGMVGAKVLRNDGKTLDSTGLFLTPWRTARERGYGSKDTGKFEKGEYIFGVNGAVAFYRREMLEQIKEGLDYFDPDFHIFYDDLDVAWRAKRFGWKGYYIPSAIAYHVRGGSVRPASGIGKPYARRYISDELEADLIKNRYLAIVKNEVWFNFLLHLPCVLLYDLIMWSYILLFRPRQIKLSILNFRYLKSSFKKRRLFLKKT